MLELHRNLNRRRVLFAWLVMCACSPSVMCQTATARKLLPVDESSQDASLRTFIIRLRTAVARRDAQFIYSVLDPSIKNSFGGDGGIAEFKNEWKLEERGSGFWNEFSTVLELGGTYERNSAPRSYIAPYVFSRFPQGVDSFTHSAIIKRNVRARSRPHETAPVVATLSYDVVRVNYEESVPTADGRHEWVKITTPAGKPAFVHRKFIRSPIDYRAFFEKKGGRWVMTTFFAGD